MEDFAAKVKRGGGAGVSRKWSLFHSVRGGGADKSHYPGHVQVFVRTEVLIY